MDGGPGARVRTVGERVADPRHAGPLDGASAVGEAGGGDRLVVRIGLWRARDGGVARARFRATTCASLVAFADAACEALEAGAPPDRLDAAELRRRVAGVHPGHRDRAELVALAVRAANGNHGAPR